MICTRLKTHVTTLREMISALWYCQSGKTSNHNRDWPITCSKYGTEKDNCYLRGSCTTNSKIGAFSMTSSSSKRITIMMISTFWNSEKMHLQLYSKSKLIHLHGEIKIRRQSVSLQLIMLNKQMHSMHQVWNIKWSAIRRITFSWDSEEKSSILTYQGI